MRKTTKTVAVLAAMSAMTVASASLAFAATGEVKNLKALNTPEEVAATGESAGTWSGSDKEGWKFKTEDGTQLKNTWAQIDGVWYYFDGEKIVQHDLKVIDDKTYFFHEDGSMMANGWYKITSDMDAYEEIEIGDQLEYSSANTYVDNQHAYDYLDYVWLYFDENGIAKENEWMQDENGYWFYFDGNVTVMNMYNFAIAPNNLDYADSSDVKLYGFDKNGCMLTGWNSVKRNEVNWNDPTADETGKIWFYYSLNGGAMQEDGWLKIGDNWYLFADRGGTPAIDSDEDIAKSTGYPLIVNSYVTSYRNSTEDEKFYIDKTGVMQKGVVKVPEDAWKITFYNTTGDATSEWEVATQKITTDTTAYFGTKGAATQALVDGKFYLDVTNTAIVPVSKKDIADVAGTKYVYDYTSASTVAVTSAAASVNFELKVTGKGTVSQADGAVEAQVIKNAFITTPKNSDGDKIKGDGIWLVDKNGDIVTNRAVLLYDGIMGSVQVELAQAGIEAAQNGTYSQAYILFGSDGKAYTNTTKTVRIGNVSYWATTSDITINGVTATVYVSSKDDNK